MFKNFFSKFYIQNISIMTKFLIAGFGIYFISMIMIFGFYIPWTKSSLIEAKKKKIESVVSVGISNLNSFYKLQKSKKLSKTQAQKMAKLFLKNIRYGKTNKEYVWINDFNHRMIMHPYVSTLYGKDLSDYKDKRGFKLFTAFVDICKKRGSGFVDYSWQHHSNKKRIVKKISFVKTFKPWNWIVGSGLYIEEEKEDIKNLYIYSSIAFLLFGLILFFIIFVMAKKLKNPIYNLSRGITEIAKGDLTQKLKCSGNDEIGMLCREFNFFTEKIYEIIDSVMNFTYLLSASSEGLSNISSKLMTTSKETSIQSLQVTTSIEQMDVNMTGIASTTEEMDQNITSITSMIDSILSSISTLKISAKTMNKAMGVINKNSNKSFEITNEAESLANKSKSTMDSLNDSVGEIGIVSEMIKNIAEKTNLLALNATIEAASAGNAGKGFAVVAFEIKELANQSAEAAIDISNKILNIQSISKESNVASNKIVKVIDNINSFSKEINESILEQSNAMNSITNNIFETDENIQQIDSSIKQLNLGSNELSKNTTEISHEISGIMKNLYNVNNSINNNQVDSKKVGDTSQHLLNTSKELENLIAYFEIKDGNND